MRRFAPGMSPALVVVGGGVHPPFMFPFTPPLIHQTPLTSPDCSNMECWDFMRCLPSDMPLFDDFAKLEHLEEL